MRGRSPTWRQAEPADFLRGQAGAEFRVLHAGAALAETLCGFECGPGNGAEGRREGVDCAYRQWFAIGSGLRKPA